MESAVVTKQVKEREAQTITDYFGNEHHVFYLRRLGNFSGIWGKEEMYNPNGIYWDIDLDYFTTMNGEHLKVMSERKIREVFEKYDSEIKMILGRLAGITIALEPEFSGGLASALKLYSIWENIFFTGPISRNSLSDNFTWRKKYLIG